MVVEEKDNVVVTPEVEVKVEAEQPDTTRIGMDSKLLTSKDLTMTPSGAAVVTPEIGTLDKFTTRKTIDDYSFTDDKLADVNENLESNFTLYDSIKDTPIGKALTVLNLNDVDWQGGPQGHLNNLDIDTGALRSAVENSSLDEDAKFRYGRAVNIIANAQNKGMKVVRALDGRYWLESEEGGMKNYSINGLLDIKEVIDKFHGKAPEDEGIPDEKEEKEIVVPDDLTPKKDEDGESIPDAATEEFSLTEAEKWYLGSFAGDVVTTVGGMAFKGAAGAGSVLSFVGGLASAAADARGDYLSGKGWGEIAGNAGKRVVLEAAEAVTFAPVSIISKLKKGSAVAKIIKRGMGVIMIGNTIDVATKTRWKEVFSKLEDDPTSLTVDDWREVTQVVTAVAGLVGGGLANRNIGKKVKKTYDINQKTKAAKSDLDLKQDLTTDALKIKGMPEYQKSAKNTDSYITPSKKLKSKADANTS